MDIVEILFLVSIWGMFIFHIIREYKKSKKDKRQQVKQLVKETDFWLEGLRLFGILFFLTGFISDINSSKHLGVLLLVIGWFLSGVDLWKDSKKKSIGIMAIAVIFGMTYYILWF